MAARTPRGRLASKSAGLAPDPPSSRGETAEKTASDVHREEVSGAERSNLVLPRSPLIGREHDLARVESLLLQEAVGLLTLTGPGGSGKTRLALQVGVNLLDHFVDGIYFVALASIRDPDLVAATIAQALGVQETTARPLAASLQDYLCDRQVLLVADNFEHLLAAAPLIAELLAHCPRLKVLATSRTSLHLYGEHIYSVPPLALPNLDASGGAPAIQQPSTPSKVDVAALAAPAAVTLFTQRALEVDPDFALTAANAVTVAAICIGVDGLPLALELAAAKLKLFSPQALLAALKQRLAVLTGGPQDAPTRQRTLRDEIAWSYELLPASEQALFRRLAVFVGGFTLDAAAAVGDANGELGIVVYDAVATLLDQHLLTRGSQADGEPRFGMLETIREYGLEQLAATGELAEAQRRHALYYLSLAETVTTSFVPDEGVSLKRLLAEQANLRLALAWSLADDARWEIAAGIASGISELWVYTGQWRECRRWSEGALAMTVAPGRSAARARLLVDAGQAAVMLGDPVAAQERLAEGLELAKEQGLYLYLGRAFSGLGWLAEGRGDYDQSLAYQREALAIHKAFGKDADVASTLMFMAGTSILQHDYAGALTLHEEAMALFKAAGAEWEVADVLHYMGWAAQRQGDYRRAWALFRDSMARWRAIGTLEWKGIPECLEWMAEICVEQFQFVVAAQLLGAVEALWERINPSAGPLSMAKTKFDQFRDHLDAAAYTAAWQEGHNFTPVQAVEFALSLPDLSASAPAFVLPRPHRNGYGLTAREVEVLRLLAQDLTYAEIADQLVVSRRTVNGHVTSIYSKLGVSRRAAATRLAAEQGLL